MIRGHQNWILPGSIAYVLITQLNWYGYDPGWDQTPIPRWSKIPGTKT
ncbi:hypothetical protein ACFLT1_00425 [Bacteroidota bacterium]